MGRHWAGGGRSNDIGEIIERRCETLRCTEVDWNIQTIQTTDNRQQIYSRHTADIQLDRIHSTCTRAVSFMSWR